ncbi:MAG: FimV/HubP family polar landmark protein [Betaproteobacteria bacterium]
MRCAIALAFSLALSSPELHAAGLGRLNVQSALGQPLRAEVEVTSVSRDEAPTLSVRLASQSAFRQANLDFNPALAAMRFSLEKRGETSYIVRITSLQPVNEPYLDLLLELSWATGRLLREYTVLLDPPSLRAAPEVVPPAAIAQAPAPAPAPTAAAPATAAPAPSALTPAPAARAAAAPVAADGYTVKAGDTLGKIAQQNKAPTVSLDQMLVALFRSNPSAFVGDNMNRLLAGRTLTIPSAADAEAISVADARREVIAQSRDFAQFRSRLAQAAAGGATLVAPAPAAAGQGQITAKVEDRAAPAKGGDQLKIAKAVPSSPASVAAARALDDEVARQRALKEQEDRAAELKKTNEALKKALELQSKSGAQAQRQAEPKAAASPAPQATAPAPTPAPVAAVPVPPPAPTPAPVAATPVPPPAPAAASVESSQAEAPATVPAVPPAAPKAEVAKKGPVAPPAPPPEASLVEQLTSPHVLGGAGAALIALVVGLNLYRRRKLETGNTFKEAGDGLRANSLFGSTGGQSVDTAATSSFNSSFIPAASQLDSNEVDPVAEADVYIAYGREEQAEDILKEALRVQPDRHAARVKLLEIFSRRGDKGSFGSSMVELRNRTGGSGDDWDRAVKLGRAFDPGNPMYAGASSDVAPRGASNELRLNPATAGGRPSTLGGGVAAAASAKTTQPARREPLQSIDLSVDSRQGSPVDTHMKPETAMQPDSRMTDDTSSLFESRVGGAMTQGGVMTRFEAMLSPAAAAVEPATGSAIDFSALDFDLGSAKSSGRESVAPPVMPAPSPAAAVSAFDLRTNSPPAAPAIVMPEPISEVIEVSALAVPSMPDLDLDISPRVSAPAATAAGPSVRSQLEESLSRPTLLGDVGTLDGEASRAAPNTDQATVPLIDFDLFGSDVEPGGRRTETQAGSPLAGQMATKLDLARGYIDLGVKDGARELLEEVMRDGTRDQRQAAVDLMKQVET